MTGIPGSSRAGRRRLGRATDDRGSMAMLLMVSMVGIMLSALLVPMIISQDRTTRFTTTRVHALDAARSGINAVLQRIRNAVDAGTGIGDSSGLPCDTLSGKVNSSGPAAYTVKVEYFTSDPIDPSAPAMKCVSGYGTYEPSTGTATPSYARLTATGTDGIAVNGSSGGRTVVSTYVFRTSNTNVPGGIIRIYPSASSTTALCLDAGSATPAAGVAVVVQPCSTASPPDQKQVFVYRPDLTLLLRSSITGSYAHGLCVDVVGPAADTPVILRPCLATGTPPPYTQQWSFDDNGAFRASLANSRTDGTLATTCFNVAFQLDGQPLKLAQCTGGTANAAQAWIPSPALGAGAAAPPQWVSYFEFGRCIDVTGQELTTPNLIAFPCKQNPSASAVTWNQKFTGPVIAPGQNSATGRIYTRKTGTTTDSCLTAPTSKGGYVTVKDCGTGTAALQQWTVANGDKSLIYKNKFTVVNPNSGWCLGLGAPTGILSWSTIVVEDCSGATEQKWNASPNLSTPALQNTVEK